jgi:zinc transport system ATP-binding protein
MSEQHDHHNHAHSRAHACQPLGDVVISVSNARFGYGGHAAATVKHLEIRAGEVVALLGSNGSGKTTLMKGVLGLVDRIDGTVELFGESVDRLQDRSAIGYLPQRQSAAGPIPVTVNELVRSGRLTRHNPLGLGRDDGAVASAISVVGLSDAARKRVSTLSGGQQRRALLARALVGGSQLLLLDEPFAGVDQGNQEAIADALDGLLHNGLTLVVVLHELGPLEPLITRVVVMDHGTVRFDGPIEDAPPELLHMGHDHDPHGGPEPAQGIGLVG